MFVKSFLISKSIYNFEQYYLIYLCPLHFVKSDESLTCTEFVI